MQPISYQLLALSRFRALRERPNLPESWTPRWTLRIRTPRGRTTLRAGQGASRSQSRRRAWPSDESWTRPSSIHYIPRMKFLGRSGAAMVALAAVLLPWAMSIVVVAHLAHEGHHHSKPVIHDAEGVKLVVHGHRHESGAPLHEHTVVVAKPATLTTRLSLIPTQAGLLPPAIASSSLTTGSFAAPADVAHGPPHISKASLILRI